jgi:putative tryptophan/tyrosine transport system substrate-binding protein
MKKTGVLSILFVVILLAVAVIADAQQPKKVPRIGYLGGASNPARIEAFRKGLRELGYVEGKNISIEYRALAADLVRLKVDVIVTAGATSTRAAKEATSTIPIVMAQDPDPIGNGFVAPCATRREHYWIIKP